MNRLVTGVGLLTLFVLAAGARAERPRVVTSTVEDGQDDVDPALTEIKVQFDQPMDQRSWSVVGGGPTFPKVVTKPKWADDRTILIAVTLEADHEYWMSLNSDTFQGFRSAGGEPAVPHPLSFKTRTAGAAAEPAQLLTRHANRDAIAALRKAIDANYAYRDRLKIDWDKAFAERTPDMEAATTPNQFARAAARLLRHAEDAHVFVRAGDRTIGTHVNANPPNFDFQSLRKTVAGGNQHDGGVVSGKLADDVGYLLIPEWGPRIAAGLDEAFGAVKDFKGLVIDVRMNGGGDENVAAEFAGRFVEEPKVYSKNRIRRDGEWLGPFDRVVKPRAEADRYAGPLAVLTGPKVGSSCESFVLMMKQGPRCQLVGDVTKGSSGNPRLHELGNGVTVGLSSWEDQLPDGTVLEGRGVTPDVRVEAALAEFRDRDPVLDAAIGALREKIDADAASAR